MSLLALLAAHAAGGGGQEPPPGSGEWPNYDPPADTTPYAFPTTAPYNAPEWAPTPTADGSGEVIHPSVIDFQTQHGMTNWNGYRYWMGITGFKDESENVEDPHILASHDGYTWEVPAGLTNPIDTAPGTPYNSDTELVYVPSEGRTYCYWREADNSESKPETVHVAWSTNGTAWTHEPPVLSTTNPGGVTTKILSPAVQQYGADDWRMVTIGVSPAVPERRTATHPLGPFANPVPLTFNYLGTVYGDPWHFTQTRVDGVSYGLLYINSPSTLVTCTSVDGAAWNVSENRPVITRSGEFDAKFYRAAFTPHEDGVSFRLWYPVNSAHPDTTGDWRLAYTVVPLSMWPAPPA